MAKFCPFGLLLLFMFNFLLPMSYELVEKISPNPNGESSELGIVVAKMVAGPSPRVLAAAALARMCAYFSRKDSRVKFNWGLEPHNNTRQGAVCVLELLTKIRKDFTITEKAPTMVFSW